MRKTIIIAAAFMLGVTGAQAQTPRKGGTIRYTAAYGSSFSGMDIHTTPRAQDEIWAEHWSRGDSGSWTPHDALRGDILTFASCGIELRVDELYLKVFASP